MRFRFSKLAQADLAAILSTSARRWGIEGQGRYAKILAAATQQVAANPEGLTTRARNELAPGIRSFHIQHARADDPNTKVRRPVHILYYRAIAPESIEIVRVLHERMDPNRHLHEVSEDKH